MASSIDKKICEIVKQFEMSREEVIESVLHAWAGADDKALVDLMLAQELDTEVLGAILQLAKTANLSNAEMVRRILLRYAASLRAGWLLRRDYGAPVPYHPEITSDINLDEKSFRTLEEYEKQRLQWESFGAECYEAAGENPGNFLQAIDELRNGYDFETMGEVVVESIRQACTPDERRSLYAFIDAQLAKMGAVRELFTDLLAELAVAKGGAVPDGWMQRFDQLWKDSELQRIRDSVK